MKFVCRIYSADILSLFLLITDHNTPDNESPSRVQLVRDLLIPRIIASEVFRVAITQPGLCYAGIS